MSDRNPCTSPCSSVAIIPARGGSKRIPRKNVRNFRGKPIIAWSITAALESGSFDEVMVSTDDAEIASTARAWGAEVPFMRSLRTADDYATTSSVLTEVLAQYRGMGRAFDLACCLYPTAPFVCAADLASGKASLLESGFDVLMTVANYEYPIWRSLQRTEDGGVTLYFAEHINARSQDLPSAFHDAGQWYWFRTAAFLRDGLLMGPNTGSVVLPAERVHDIDTEKDWRMAELKHRLVFG